MQQIFLFGKMPKTCGLATTSSHSRKVGKNPGKNKIFTPHDVNPKKQKSLWKGGLIWEDVFNLVPSSKMKS